MNTDASLLSACVASREAFDKIKGHVAPDELSPLAGQWWPLVTAYYTRDSAAGAIDLKLLREQGKRWFDVKHLDTHLDYLDTLPDPGSPKNIVHEVLELKQHRAGMLLAQAIASRAKSKEVLALTTAYSDLLQATTLDTSQTIVGGGFEDLWDSLSDERKLPVFPERLNTKFDGGILPGSFVLVFGYPEMGKTLFCANLAANWLRMGKRVLYIGNEDKIQKIQKRILSNLANMSSDEMKQHRDEAEQRGRDRGWADRLTAVHLHPGTIPEIEDWVVKSKADCLIVDQIRNVASAGGGRNDNNTSRMNRVAVDYRQLISRYNLYGVGTAQANPGEHGNKKVLLSYDDVEGSRTGLPSQSDVQLGISGDEAMLAAGNRYISICRNKESGDHTGLVVKFDTLRSTVA